MSVQETSARRPTDRPPSPDVTLGIYAHTDLNAMREALDSIEWERSLLRWLLQSTSYRSLETGCPGRGGGI